MNCRRGLRKIKIVERKKDKRKNKKDIAGIKKIEPYNFKGKREKHAF